MSGVWQERLTDVGFAAGWRAVRMLPAPVARQLFDRGGAWAGGRPGKGLLQLRANLRVATKGRLGDAELDALTVRAARSYARYWQEAFRLPAMDHGRIVVDTELVGYENLQMASAGGRGVILALPHSGNWDMAGVWLVGHSGTFTTVAERLKPESLYRKFVEFRETLGFEVLPLNGGDRPPATVLAERLRANKVVCLLGDRDLTASGVPVTFFGEQTLMPAGPAHLAATTGAALLPVGCWFTADGWHFRIHPPIKVGTVQAATQAVADVFAADIAAHPADWHMLQQLWLADLPESRRAALARRLSR